MPVFNAAPTLGRALQSVLAQTHRDFDLVVVDDGSTDSSATIISDAQTRDSRIKLLRRPHQGIVSALTAGLEQCKAPYVVRMDADDWSHPLRVATQVQFLEDNPDVGLVACCVTHGGCRAATAGYAAYVDWTNDLVTHEQIASSRFVESPFAHPAVCFRRDLVARFGGYREGDFPEDYELWLRWLDAGVRVHKLPEPLLHWHDSGERLSRTDTRYRFEAFYRIKARYLARWLETHNRHHPDVVVWGAGRTTRKRAEMLTEHGIVIRAYVDVDPRKIGKIVHGREVLSPRQLPPPDKAFVIGYVASRGARQDIERRLLLSGYVLGESFIPAA